MKKVLILMVAVLGFAVAATAQPRAIGARVGYGGEFSYQHSFGSNFGELDLGWYAHNFDVVGIYDFVLAGSGLCNFYLGPGWCECGYRWADRCGMEHSAGSAPDLHRLEAGLFVRL